MAGILDKLRADAKAPARNPYADQLIVDDAFGHPITVDIPNPAKAPSVIELLRRSVQAERAAPTGLSAPLPTPLSPSTPTVALPPAPRAKPAPFQPVDIGVPSPADDPAAALKAANADIRQQVEGDNQQETDVTPAGKRQLILDESSGKDHLEVYKDSKGIPTIGHGFNLAEPSNAATFEQVTGMKVQDALDGKPITPEHQDQLLELTIASATEDAKQLVPKFDTLPAAAQDAIVNFVFNVGETTAREFKQTLGAINRGDGETASKLILQSAYAKQVGKRAERVSKALKTIGAK